MFVQTSRVFTETVTFTYLCMHAIILIMKIGTYVNYFHCLGPKCVSRAANSLHNRYVRNRHFANDDWPPYHPKHYTPLTIIHHAGSRTQAEIDAFAQELTARGSIAAAQCSNIYSNTIKTIKELFTFFEGVASDSYTVLIEGAPGIGKTILSKEIALQWTKENILKSKDLLFLLFMRDPQVKSITGVKSLVRYFFQSNEKLTDKITE